MFEKAIRMKLRFDTERLAGLTVEDLWELTLKHLDEIAVSLHQQLKSGADISFVDAAKKSDEIVQLKFDIVKHIIDVKLAERDASQTAAANKERKQQILGIIAQKKNEQLAGASLEELEELAKSL